LPLHVKSYLLADMSFEVHRIHAAKELGEVWKPLGLHALETPEEFAVVQRGEHHLRAPQFLGHIDSGAKELVALRLSAFALAVSRGPTAKSDSQLVDAGMVGGVPAPIASISRGVAQVADGAAYGGDVIVVHAGTSWEKGVGETGWIGMNGTDLGQS
jgi:hypothetical protein